MLQAFIPMLASWVGRGELKTLTELELDGMPYQLTGKELLCGFYLNELLMRMVHRDDPYPHLYQLYQKTLDSLYQAQMVEQSLRLFEKNLLQQLGYGLLLDCEASQGTAITAEQDYRYHPELGFLNVVHAAEADHYIFSGKSLLAFHRNELNDPIILKDAKRLMRIALSLHLGDKPIMSRELLK
jgi:DNA repair protein RecO (recombination protein O)